MSEIIKFYHPEREHGYLSNLFPTQVMVDGILFNSSEAAYQYGKPIDKNLGLWIATAPDQRYVAKVGHLVPRKDRVPNWDIEKLHRMRKCLKEKFNHNAELWEMLINTGDSLLVEDSPTDNFWGIGSGGKGLNILGLMLMDVRRCCKIEEL